MLAVEVTEPVVSADPVALRGFPFERHIEPIGAAFLQARKQQHRQAATGGAAEEDEEDEEDDDAPEEEAGGGSAGKETNMLSLMEQNYYELLGLGDGDAGFSVERLGVRGLTQERVSVIRTPVNTQYTKKS